jgi:hypothetical protein
MYKQQNNQLLHSSGKEGILTWTNPAIFRGYMILRKKL